MRLALSLFALLMFAAPAWAQQHTRTEPAPIDQVALASHSVAVMKAFEVSPKGLKHAASGIVCPSLSVGTVLTAIGAGPPPGLSDQEGVWCEYSDQDGPVERLFISRDPPETPILSRAWCNDLPHALQLKMGPGIIPGVGKTTAPTQQTTLPTVSVAGQSLPLWRCSTIRAPLDQPVVVADTSATRLPSGWTARAIHTPAAPPCCRGYRGPTPVTFFVQPVLLIVDAVGAEIDGTSPPPNILRLRPGAP